ncbi:WD40-repeat-containing domain protein [Leucosporidium creatinivorum]|uniref:WD40-repeat-containing domain protein n=1 Tax=Leucosporidium creatinivorum TaxID=106004 RepID=A0A1Y2F8Q0_9BASI|nr:WD40-repeat-containing domain protein [Leucosporidium creatinivorum]
MSSTCPTSSSSIPIPSSSTATATTTTTTSSPPLASSARSLSRIWERIQQSSPTIPSPFASPIRTPQHHDHQHTTTTRPSTDSSPTRSSVLRTSGPRGGVDIPSPSSSTIRVEGEPLVTRIRGSVDRLSGSWPDRFVPRWGSSKERERARGERILGLDDDDSDFDQSEGPLDGEEGVVVDDEACFVDGWEGKVDFLSSFPQEISLYILLHLDFQSLLLASRVSRQWRSLSLDNILWRDLFHQNTRWRIREDPPEDCRGGNAFPFPNGAFVSQPSSPSLKRAASSLSRAASKRSTSGAVHGAEGNATTPSGSRISRGLTDMMADLGGLSIGGGGASGSRSQSREPEESPPTTLESPSAYFASPAPITPRRPPPTAVVLPTNAFATPTSFSTQSAYADGTSLSRTSSRASSSAALSSLASSLSALPPSLTPSRRASSATLPPLGPVPSPSLATTPSAPLFLDWPKLYKDRWLLEKRWKEGKAKGTFLKGHTDSVYCLQFDERRVISGSRDQTIRIWDLPSATCTKVLTGHEGSVLCLQSDSKVLISGSSDSRILVWDMVGEEGTGKGQWEIKMSLVGHNMGVLDLCFDEDWIVSCSKDTTIRVWHRQTGELYRTLAGHRGPVNAVQLLNNRVVSASGDSLMKLWDVLTGEVLRVFSGHERGLACVKLSASGKLLASGSNDKTVRIWDAETGQCLKKLEGHTDLVRSLAIDEEGGKVVSASYDRTTRVWEWEEGKELLKFKGHTSLVFDVAFNASRIVSSSHDQRILVMDFGDGLDTRLFL